MKKIETKRLRGSLPKPKTEQASGSADQPSYQQRVEAESWNNQTVKDIKHQLAVRGFSKTTNPDGSIMKKADHLRDLKNLMK